jgi:hypothetical protein
MTFMRSTAATTGIFVVLRRISASRLSRFGARCSTTKNAIPLSGGIVPKNVLRASIPPADAPMPTMRVAGVVECSTDTFKGVSYLSVSHRPILQL